MNTPTPMTPLARLAALVAALVTVSTLVFAAPAAAAVVYDGSTQDRAAASCWDAKQNDPGATSGLFWLVTPRLQVPTRFYCDQVTDGGGWVLIGRGRQGWVEGGDGSGTTAQVANPIQGTTAMRAKQLSNKVIDGLLDGGRVQDLEDGVRLRRATNTAGTTWQEDRVVISKRDRWSWAWPAGLPVSSYTVDGRTTKKSQTTSDLTLSTDRQRAWTHESSTNGFVRGFSYGRSGPAGTVADDSYLYSTVAGGQYATPFTQMFIRPKLPTSLMSYAAVPDAGIKAQTIAAVPQSGARPTTWGVTGLGKGGTLDYATEVSAFAQIGQRVFVGGNFTTVRNSNGKTSVPQPYLAAFDATTGEYISSWRPTFNNQVKSLKALPNGRLAVGGEFTRVNGKAAVGIVVLSPTSGKTYSGFTGRISQTANGAKRWVRALDVGGRYLYIGGGFTHYKGGSSRTTYRMRNIVRVSASTGKPDSRWRPNLGTGLRAANGKPSVRSSVLSLDVSDKGTRIYAAGQFTQGYVGADGKSAVSRPGAAAITTSAPARFQKWSVRFSSARTASHYQQAVKQVGSRVWLGGSQHSLFAYSSSKLALTSIRNIMLKGGDTQAIESRGGVVYASCHCNNWNYSGTTRYDEPRASGHTQVDRIGYVGAWNASSGAYVPEFAPTMRARHGEGPWALMSAADGTLWVGGDFVSAVGEDGKNQWVGGFARFAMRPHTPPATPSRLAVSLDKGDAKLSWSASRTSGVSYEIIRNNRVIGTTTPGATSATVPSLSSTDRWFIRTVDTDGNRSASTQVAKATKVTTPPSTTTTLVPASAQWAYWSKTAAPATNWTTSFDDSGWTYGGAPLGYGSSGLRTTLTKPSGVVQAYFRRTFQIGDVSDYSTVTIRTRADDGAIVIVNGTKVASRRIKAGVTYADDAISTSQAVAEDWTISIPPSLLQDGTNRIAFEVRANSKSSSSLTHQATIIGTLK